jgi:hypothetical protein
MSIHTISSLIIAAVNLSGEVPPIPCDIGLEPLDVTLRRAFSTELGCLKRSAFTSNAAPLMSGMKSGISFSEKMVSSLGETYIEG